MKKIVSIFLCLSLVMAMSMIAYGNEGGELSTGTDVSVQESASEAYDELIASFPQERTTGSKIYPEYFGGSYINERGQLVIYVTEPTRTFSLQNRD
jgi:hypothetical protein